MALSERSRAPGATPMELNEVLNEFVIESTESLGRLDREIVELEQNPQDAALLGRIFRTIHSMKGTCGFLGFTALEQITHHTENLLSQFRDGTRAVTPPLVSLMLETIDTIRMELASIEETAQETGNAHRDLIERQERAARAEPFAGQKAVKARAGTGGAGGVQTAGVPALQAEYGQGGGTTAPGEAQPAAPSSTLAAESTLRVEIGLFDELMRMVDDLSRASAQVLQFNANEKDAGLAAAGQRLERIAKQLQSCVKRARMQPISTVWNRFPRVVRDLAMRLGKQISLEMNGAQMELDKPILEAIKNPLLHIVRNSCDHGIEPQDMRLRAGKPAQGKLRLRAFQKGGDVHIKISDDGQGIDPQDMKQSAIRCGLVQAEEAERMNDDDLLQLAFLPGCSTKHEASNISGRGVGLDVVKTDIEKLGGAVDLVSLPGQGCTVRLRIPIARAIIRGLTVACGNERFIIPQASLLELMCLEGEPKRQQVGHIEGVSGSAFLHRRGRLLPLVYLNQTLQLPSYDGARDAETISIVILQVANRQFGLVVDSIGDIQELVIQPLGKQLSNLPYLGATVMHNGKLALILDVENLASGDHGAMTQSLGRMARTLDSVKDGGSEEELVSPVRRSLMFRDTATRLETGAQTRLYLTFHVGGLFLGIEAEKVREVLRDQEITPVPLAPRVMEGLLHWQGQMVAVIDMRRRLFLAPREKRGGRINVVVRTGEGVVSLLVDQVADVIEVTEDRLETLPQTLLPLQREFVDKVGMSDGRLLLVLNMERVSRVAPTPNSS